MNQKKFISTTVIVLVVVLVGMAGYFILTKRSSPTEPANSTDTQSPQTAPSSINNTSPQTSKPTETVGWKTYRNESFGVSFQYPPDFRIDTSQDRLRVGVDLKQGQAVNYIDISIMKRPEKDLSELSRFFSVIGPLSVVKTQLGKNIDAIKAVSNKTGETTYYIMSDGFNLQIGDSVFYHRELLKTEGLYDYYRIRFDKILQSIELLFPEVSISEEDLKSLKPSVASSISEQEALAVIKQHGFDTAVSGTSIKLKPANQPFFQSYTGPGSPIRIAGQYWEIRIPTSSDPECRSVEVLFVDATTGEFYNLGTSTSCN
jgi:hypothetical protein